MKQELSAAENNSRRWIALTLMLTGLFMPLVDYFIINMMAPSIQASLGATSSQMQLAVSAFPALYAIFLVTGARLGDLYGRRRIFLLGVFGFSSMAISSVFTTSILFLIGTRALMGLFSALLAPQVLAYINAVFVPSERAKAVGFMGMVYGLSSLLGMILGGLLVAWHPFGLTWQIVFLFYAVLGSVVFFGSAVFVDESFGGGDTRLDLVGVGLLFVTLTSLVVPLVKGRSLGWPIWTLALLSIVPFAFAGLLKVEKHKTRLNCSPLVDFDLLHNRNFLIGVSIALTFYLAFAFLFCLSLLLQNEHHLSTIQTGLTVLPFAVAFFLSSFVSPVLLQHLGAKVLVIGFAFLTIGLLGLSLCVFYHGESAFGIPLLITGIGSGITLPSLLRVVTSGLETKHAGLAAGLLLTAMQIGAALGYVLIGGLFFLILGPAPDDTAYHRASIFVDLCCSALLGTDCVLAIVLSRPGKVTSRQPVN